MGKRWEVVAQDGIFEDVVGRFWPPPLTPFSSDSGYQATHNVSLVIREISATVGIVQLAGKFGRTRLISTQRRLVMRVQNTKTL